MVFHTFQYSIIVNWMCFPKNHRVLGNNNNNNNKAGIYKHSNDYSVIKSLLIKFFLVSSKKCAKRPPALVAELFRKWCTNQCGRSRMWYVGGSRPDGAQVGRFSSWGTVVPKGFLAESAYFSLRIRHSAAS